MKNILFPAILPFLAISMSLWAADADSANNIVINGDMEAWEQTKPSTGTRPVPKYPEGVSLECFDCDVEVPDDDTSVPMGVSISPDRLHRHGGDCSAKVVNNDPDQVGALSLREIPVEPSTKYLVRVWMKGEEIFGDRKANRGVVVWFMYGPQDNFWSSPLTHMELVKPEVVDGTFDWTKFEFTVDIPEGIALLRVNLQLRKATGTAWFDDLEVIPMGGAAKPASQF